MAEELRENLNPASGRADGDAVAEESADDRLVRRVDDAAVGMALVTPDGRFEHVDAALGRFLGFDSAERKPWPELIASDHFADLREGRKDYCQITQHHLHADGRVIWYELSVSSIRDDTGTVRNFLVQITDITERVAADERNRILVQRLQRQTERLAASEQKYRLIAENAADVVFRFDQDGRIDWISPSVDDALGAPPEYWIGRDLRTVVSPEDRRPAIWLSTVLDGGVVRERVRVVGADGVTRWTHALARPLSDADGRVVGGQAALRLIDDEVAAEQQAEEARNLLRASTDALLDPQVLLEAVRDSAGQVVDFVYREVNQAACDYLGLSRAELIGHGFVEMFPGVVEAGLFAEYLRCLATGEPVVIDDLTYDSEVLVDTRRYDVRATRATANSITLTWRDVTERYLSAQRVAASEQKYRLIAENVGDVVCHVRDGRFAWVSPSVGGVLGGSPDYWVGRQVREVIPAGDRPAFAHRLKTVTEGTVVNQRVRLVALDGVTHWFHIHAKPFYDASGQRDGHTTTLRLIDDEVAAERALDMARDEQAETDEGYRRAMEHAAVAMCLVTPDGRWREVNEAACQLFGYDAETLKQMTWRDLTPPDYLDEGMKDVTDLHEGRIDSFRVTKPFIHADGRRIWVDLSVSCLRDRDGRVEGDVALITDVTARVEADERNRRLAHQLQRENDQRAAQTVGFGVTAMEIGGHSDPLAAVHAQLDALWSIYPGVPDDVRMQMEIATAEVAANIVEHTGLGQPLRIRMNAALVDNQVHVAFADNGPPAAVDLTKVAMPDPTAQRGRGLAMAQALLDQLAYRCDETGNHWTLISKRFA